MPFYFVCPGDAQVSKNTVQCTEQITTVEGDVSAYWITKEQLPQVIDGIFLCVVTILAAQLIRRSLS